MSDDKEPESDDIHFEPIITLPQIDLPSLEEEEEVMVKLRAKLFRFDATEEPPEWKERGTGEVKILKHKVQKTCRFLMRRDKTLKVCGNHSILPSMELKVNCGNERAWVWSTPADYADEEKKVELLAIRFANVENAQKFKEHFEDAKKIMDEYFKNIKEAQSKEPANNASNSTESGDNSQSGSKKSNEQEKETDKLESKLNELTVKDSNKGSNNANDEAER